MINSTWNCLIAIVCLDMSLPRLRLQFSKPNTDKKLKFAAHRRKEKKRKATANRQDVFQILI